MQDWFFKQGGRDRLVDWLDLDSRIDSGLAETWAWWKNRWSAGSSFFARFRLTGWRRLANEAACESLTLAAGSLVVLYALALPALVEFDESKFSTGQYSVTFLDANGNEIGKRGILHNDAVPLEEIPDHMIKATLAIEDRRFFEHFGVDFVGTARALMENLRANDVVQGGSSLTQQLAKNMFLSSERSITRKIKELFFAFLLESRFTKRQILKMYLDRAYMGGGAFGVEAASLFYFGKTVREVNLAEAAMLAALYKAPGQFAPHINLPASRARTNLVLTAMVEAGYYTSGQVHAARLHPAQIVENRNTNSPDWFLDWAFEEIQRIAEGKGQYVLTARTTVDLNLQKLADEALITTVRQKGRGLRFNSGAIAVMETDGMVRAIAGGVDYGESQFNRATHATRQPGSSFKVYVYTTAFENGFTPDTMVRDSAPACGGRYVQNYGGGGGGGGRIPLSLAFAKSLNTVAVQLSLDKRITRPKVVEMTRRLGITGIRPSCTMALGDYGITPLQHVGGVATLANGGKLAKPYGIIDIVTSKGELIYSRERDEPEAPQVVKREVAERMNQIMHKVVMEGTGQRAALEFTHVAGKTGTSSGPKDIWFVGFTGKYVAGVWLGNDDNHDMSGGNTGGQIAAPVWHSFMSVAHTSMNIPRIPGLDLHPVQVAEQQRIAYSRAETPEQPEDTSAQGRKSLSLMPESTREALKRLSAALRKAAGLPPPAGTAASSDKRADSTGTGGAASGATPSSATVSRP